MDFLDFFAGIGGFRRGMELAGHKCVGFCEFDKFATASYTSMHLLTEEQRKYLSTLPLNKRQKEILKEEYRNGEWYANDIRRVYAGDIPKANCWCFGFPCNDISVAGKQGSQMTDIARCLKARYNKGMANHAGQDSGIAIPVLTPDRAEKRQNGRRFKENGEPMFTLTAQDRHGVGIGIGNPIEKDSDGIFIKISEELTVYAVWYEKYQCYIAIRKLTPKECFRLQGWTDDYFEKAQFVNSDSQLYKQAGNGVTVSVIQAIAEKLKEGDGKVDKQREIQRTDHKHFFTPI